MSITEQDLLDLCGVTPDIYDGLDDIEDYGVRPVEVCQYRGIVRQTIGPITFNEGDYPLFWPITARLIEEWARANRVDINSVKVDLEPGNHDWNQVISGKPDGTREGLRKLVEWLDEVHGPIPQEEIDAVRAEWGFPPNEEDER